MIPVIKSFLGKGELKNITEAVKSGWIASGKFIPEFEEKFAKYCGIKHGIATFNGTAALHLALSSLGIKSGDEVIVPTLTFISTANAVRYTGAKPVFADSNPEYWCIDPGSIRDRITEKTRAIIPVHLYGHPCDMKPILEIAEEHNLYIIEDAAEAHGAEYLGKKVGSFGDISCFSFYYNKTITTGEGGMCITNNPEIKERMEILKDHGKDKKRKYIYNEMGFNYRMTNMQAAIGIAQMERIDDFIEKKRRNAKLYNSLLKGKVLSLPPGMSWAKSTHWLYSVLVEKRDELMKRLGKGGVETRPFFCPMHTMDFCNTDESFPTAEGISKKGISLPSSVNLKKDEIKHITELIKSE